MRNHDLVYRPLRGGVRIFNPAVDQPGTLGFVAADENGGRWIVSCCHVLSSGAGLTEPVYQPLDDGPCVAIADPARVRADLDCAAARIVDGVASITEVLGIGPPGAPAEPVPGMEVIKSGAATGITEGTITEVSGGRVEIEPVGLPEDYVLSEAGDSGAVWVAKASLAPVVLHQGGSAGPRCFAYGIPVVTVLSALNLRVLRAAAVPAAG